MQHIRNFSIIAHIDHGKSTLADRIIQLCGGLSDREMEAQVLDSMDLERERGITIKAQTASRSNYKARRTARCIKLNLLDTPGHVDFSVRSEPLARLRVKARCCSSMRAQGVEAQTVANCYNLALELRTFDVIPMHQQDRPPVSADHRQGEAPSLKTSSSFRRAMKPMRCQCEDGRLAFRTSSKP